MTQALEAFRRHYADRTAAARAWKAGGGKVVGYLCDNVPDELISAAGFFPLRISGDPQAGRERVARCVDSLYPPDVTVRPGFVDSIYERLLDGTYDFVDHLVVPHNRTAIQAIYRDLREARGERPELREWDMHYLDKAWSSSFVSEVYNRDRLFDFKAKLESWSGAPISDAALSRAIDEANENKALLARVAALRAADPPRLSGVDALRIIGASMFMGKAEHNLLLEAFLATADKLPARTGPRVFLGGSPLDHIEVYEAIEAAGATVVAEDHCWGNRSFDLPVTGLAGGGDAAMRALAARFHSKPACSITFPLSATVAGCVRRAAAATADAAIFYVMDRDLTQSWETPDEVRGVEAAGIPALHLQRQTYGGGDLAALTARVAEFLKGAADRRAALREGAPA